MILWPPVAATSRARLTFSCPLTSEKSTSYLFASMTKISRRSTLTGVNFLTPLKQLCNITQILQTIDVQPFYHIRLPGIFQRDNESLLTSSVQICDHSLMG